MKFLKSIRFSIPFFFFFLLCMVYVCVTSVTPSFVLASHYQPQVCEFPAIFNFGDSNSDTGGLAAAIRGPPPLTNGHTFFHRPTGRYSDGRLIIDFIAESFGLPYLDAYLDSLGTNFTHGANFATSASTIELPSIMFPHPKGFSPFYLEIQYDQFKEFMSKSDFIRLQGGIFASLVPKHEFFQDALYTFDIGQNDLTRGFFGNKTLKQVKDSVPDIIDRFSRDIEYFIHHLGARYLWIHNTGPIGCLPYVLKKFLTAERDEFGCSKAHNEVAQYFNHKLKEALIKLRQRFSPAASITYVDVYSVKYSLYNNPGKYGFEKPLEACCGYGKKYNYGIVRCGYSKVVNGSEINGVACERPSKRVNWDGIHYTEAANKFIFQHISSGSFSDPSIPLNMTCHLPQT